MTYEQTLRGAYNEAKLQDNPQNVFCMNDVGLGYQYNGDTYRNLSDVQQRRVVAIVLPDGRVMEVGRNLNI